MEKQSDKWTGDFRLLSITGAVITYPPIRNHINNKTQPYRCYHYGLPPVVNCCYSIENNRRDLILTYIYIYVYQYFPNVVHFENSQAIFRVVQVEYNFQNNFLTTDIFARNRYSSAMIRRWVKIKIELITMFSLKTVTPPTCCEVVFFIFFFFLLTICYDVGFISGPVIDRFRKRFRHAFQSDRLIDLCADQLIFHQYRGRNCLGEKKKKYTSTERFVIKNHDNGYW